MFVKLVSEAFAQGLVNVVAAPETVAAVVASIPDAGGD